jgi:glycosyltransferase involved in cell wall biosynthesis
MKIGISCNRFGKGGGFERYALDLARGWLAAGQRLAVFSRRFDDVPESRQVERHRIRVGWLPSGKLRDHAFSWQARDAHRHCDVLVGCSYVVGADIAVCGGTHRGYMLHSERPAGFLDRRQVGLENRYYAKARYVIAHSRLMQDELMNLYGLSRDKVRLLYPPVDTRRFRPIDDDARRALRQRFGFGDEPVFVFPSSDHRRKGLDMLAEGLARADVNGVLAVAGRAVGEARPNVRALGYVENMEDLYRAADFAVLASNYEPFGLVGVESVLCGTPVVMADNIACLEVIDPRAALRFSRKTPNSLVAALRAAVDMRARGVSRLADPLSHLHYDPSLETHIAALQQLADSAMAGRV